MSILHAPVRILGCGNPLMGNDGVGLKVIEALHKTELKDLKDLDIEDAGVCGLDLLNLLDGRQKGHYSRCSSGRQPCRFRTPYRR